MEGIFPSVCLLPYVYQMFFNEHVFFFYNAEIKFILNNNFMILDKSVLISALFNFRKKIMKYLI